MEGAHRRWSTSSQSQYSFRTSVSSLSEVEEASPPAPVEDRVFVAVPEDVKHGKSTLLWALENPAKGCAGVVVAHVHCPAQMIPMMGAKVHHSTMNPQRVDEYRKKARADAQVKLDEYVLLCRRLKVSCEKIIIDKDDVATGLEQLIAFHGITKLVMGAAADKHYSKRMKSLKSKTALRLTELAASSCKIWFICKGHLICTREADTTVLAIPPSPALTVASKSSVSSTASHTRSVTVSQSESEASSSSGSPRHDLVRSRTEVAMYPSQQGSTCAPSRLYESFEHGPMRAPRRPTDYWDEFGRSQSSWYDLSGTDDVVTISGSVVPHQMEKPDAENFSTPSHELENPGIDADIYDRLTEALSEVELSKKEAYEESTKRRRAERDMISALQKIKELENLYQYEIRQRKAIEETLEKQANGIDEMKRQHDASSSELHDVKEQKLVLEQQITEMASAIKDYEEKMSANKSLIQMLQADNEKLQQERDAAASEAESLRQKSEQKIPTPLPAETLTTEFSYFELEQATQGFDERLKIGEGGFGSVYKGFLRNTTVAIKLLAPQSMQGQSEFNQEVAVLGRVRHPNLVTLIGACREAFCLVYEFLPNGSLEDRLACAGNTPPLTWRARTRIILEMCSALTFLHSSQVVHGDLKPGNILLDGNHVSKLGDFGICRLLLGQSNTTTTRAITTTRLHRTATPKGTFAYMDPELLSTGELTPRSDVYSLGVIILRLLTGRPPARIAEAVEDAVERGELHAVLDPAAGDWPFVQASQLARVGLRCAEMSRRRRPDLAGEVWSVVEPLAKAAAGRPAAALLGLDDDDRAAPAHFVCPIFQEVMADPHVAADGFTYEREAIMGWLDGGHDTSPMTNLTLHHCELTPNRALRSAILEWQQQLHQ
ncbi:unnamed protein product [Urochloa decumbens]|uniref:RING-type E3 ubiquitin transferase n=3 Tax=Urochloa decumbens TaxID=240449 RepID=A0ABC9CIK0_9POAL